MSFLKNIAKKGNQQVKERVKKTVKQKKDIVKQKKDIVKQKEEPFEVNPTVITLEDIPNTNIMTAGKLIGVRLRAGKPDMLKKLIIYIKGLIENAEN